MDPPAIPHSSARSPRSIAALRTKAWLVSYGLLGLTQNGLVPVLMPLVAPHGGAAGLTYAAFSLLGLFAPLGWVAGPTAPAATGIC